jgi:hypothetical protein
MGDTGYEFYIYENAPQPALTDAQADWARKFVNNS